MRKRRGAEQRARAAGDEDDQELAEALEAAEDGGDGDDRRRVVPRKPRRLRLRLGERALRLAHQPGHPRLEALVGRTLRLHLEVAARNDGAAAHVVAQLLGLRQRLARQPALVDARAPGGDAAVGGDRVAGTHREDGARSDRADGDAAAAHTPTVGGAPAAPRSWRAKRSIAINLTTSITATIAPADAASTISPSATEPAAAIAIAARRWASGGAPRGTPRRTAAAEQHRAPRRLDGARAVANVVEDERDAVQRDEEGGGRGRAQEVVRAPAAAGARRVGLAHARAEVPAVEHAYDLGRRQRVRCSIEARRSVSEIFTSEISEYGASSSRASSASLPQQR